MCMCVELQTYILIHCRVNCHIYIHIYISMCMHAHSLYKCGYYIYICVCVFCIYICIYRLCYTFIYINIYKYSDTKISFYFIYRGVPD